MKFQGQVILVTGATGGVGSLAVNMLAQKGYRVAALTGKPLCGPKLAPIAAQSDARHAVRLELAEPAGEHVARRAGIDQREEAGIAHIAAIPVRHAVDHDGLEQVRQAGRCQQRQAQRIDALSLDATSLNPMGSGGYKLHLSLRNKTAVDVAAPSIELSLTDANGAPLARRVLGPEALSPALTQVNAESEQSLSLVFSTGGQRVSGYSVNIFYP